VADKPLLAGEGVDAGEINDIVLNRGFALASSPEGAEIILVRKPDRAQLERLLSKHPPYALIEMPASPAAFGKRLKTALAKQGLFLSLSTASAFNADLTNLLCTVCCRSLGMSEERRFDVETAFEEALSNAMVHGNLDIASVLRNDPSDFELYCDLVNERLTTPLYAERRIEILATWSAGTLDIEVHDEGRGYDIANFSALPQLEAKCGRGFSLIRDLARNVTIGEHGRSLTMSFSP
jgi:anti-sigma regulatory factor (Ser/Thr protein kinase)